MKSKVADIIRAGSIASITSAAALMVMGRIECRDAASPINAPSQWIWGRNARQRRGFSVKHTLVGYAVHHVAALVWGGLYTVLGRNRPVAGAIATAATAAVVDFRL